MRLELIACSLRNRFNLSPRVDFMPHIRIHINEAPSARHGSVEDRLRIEVEPPGWLLGLTDSWGLPAGVDLYASIPHFYFFGCHLAKIFHISRHRAQLRAAPCQKNHSKSDLDLQLDSGCPVIMRFVIRDLRRL